MTVGRRFAVVGGSIGVIATVTSLASVGEGSSGSSEVPVSDRKTWDEHVRPQMEELMREPKVRVGKSSIPGAGDGVFTTCFAPKGTLLTWETQRLCLHHRDDDGGGESHVIGEEDDDEDAAAEFFKASSQLYDADYFKAWDERIQYSRVASREPRSPRDGGGVGHVVNDGARIDANEALWSSSLAREKEDDVVEAYVAKSLAMENVVVAYPFHDKVALFVAKRDLQPGEELFRSYGPGYWLGHVQNCLLLQMQFARCDLRMLAGLWKALAKTTTVVAKDDPSGKFEADAVEIFETANRRLDKLFASYAVVVAGADRRFEPMTQKHPHRHLNGYGVFDAVRMSPELRRSYARRLGLDDEDRWPGINHIHGLSHEAYLQFFLEYCLESSRSYQHLAAFYERRERLHKQAHSSSSDQQQDEPLYNEDFPW